jgi:hypothetical protein
MVRLSSSSALSAFSAVKACLDERQGVSDAFRSTEANARSPPRRTAAEYGVARNLGHNWGFVY